MLANAQVCEIESLPIMAKMQSRASDGRKRVVVKMSPEVHRRLRLYCVATAQNIEDVGAQWIEERLLIEEKKLK
jgi:hypothetical protein